jgi:hypothetical protein
MIASLPTFPCPFPPILRTTHFEGIYYQTLYLQTQFRGSAFVIGMFLGALFDACKAKFTLNTVNVFTPRLLPLIIHHLFSSFTESNYHHVDLMHYHFDDGFCRVQR